MIIRRMDDELLLITQVDHAALAGRIAAAWRADGLPGRATRARVLEAAAQHDAGWQAIDAAPIVDPGTGAPLDFIAVPLEVRQDVWSQALATLAPRDPYVAALVAHHAATVYRRFLSTPGWEEFFPTMERRRDDLLATQRLDVLTFLADYAILGITDLCSLVFCLGTQEPGSREGYEAVAHVGAHAHGAPAAEAAGKPEGEEDEDDEEEKKKRKKKEKNTAAETEPRTEADGRDQAEARAGVTTDARPHAKRDAEADIVQGGWVQITPDPFDGGIVRLDVPARRIPARRYASDADLRDTIARAPIVRLTGFAASSAPAPSTSTSTSS